MNTLYGDRDRAKASEHALFLVRELAAPAPLVAAALSRIAGRRSDISIAHSASDWRIAIRESGDRGSRDIFEGVIRFERDAADVTHVVLIGRFLEIPHDGRRATRDRGFDRVENAVAEAFDSLLADLAAAIAADPTVKSSFHGRSPHLLPAGVR